MVHCELDGKEIVGGAALPGMQNSETKSSSINQQTICQSDSESLVGSPGEHELTVNITKPSDMRFYLDYIVYESLPGASVDGEMLVIGSENFDASRDPHLTFSPGWVLSDAWESNAMLTRTPGSNVTVSFNGASS